MNERLLCVMIAANCEVGALMPTGKYVHRPRCCVRSATLED